MFGYDPTPTHGNCFCFFFWEGRGGTERRGERERALLPGADSCTISLWIFLVLLAVWFVRQANCLSFRESQQTLWAGRQDMAAEARGAPLFHKAMLPKPVRITPSFLGSGLFALSEADCFLASGQEVWRVSAQHHASDMDEVREAIALGAPTAPLSSISAQLVCAAATSAGGDIQSVTAHKSDDGAMTVAAVDAAGGIAVCVKHRNTGDGSPWKTKRIDGPGFRDGEFGWSGLALGEDGRQVAVARHFQRSVGVYDIATGGLVRMINTVFNPNSISWLGTGGAGQLPGAEGLIAVAEHKCISLWDMRVGSRAVQRLVPTASSPLYSVNWGRGVVGCCGGDRSIYVYDPKRWTIRGRAMGVTKTQALSLSFSAADPRLYFVHGCDTQLVCGQWDDAGGPSVVGAASATLIEKSVSTGGHKGTHVVTGGAVRRVFEFRSVGRWIAAHKLQHTDSFFGVCDQQALYVLPPIDSSDLLAQASSSNKRKRSQHTEDDLE